MSSLAGDLWVLAGLLAFLAFTVLCTVVINPHRKTRVRAHLLVDRLLNRELGKRSQFGLAAGIGKTNPMFLVMVCSRYSSHRGFCKTNPCLIAGLVSSTKQIQLFGHAVICKTKPMCIVAS